MNIYKQKIVINFTNGQGLGNQLWIFFSGIQIAQKLNCKIEFGNGKVFKGFFLIKRKFITKKFIEIKRKSLNGSRRFFTTCHQQGFLDGDYYNPGDQV